MPKISLEQAKEHFAKHSGATINEVVSIFFRESENPNITVEEVYWHTRHLFAWLLEEQNSKNKAVVVSARFGRYLYRLADIKSDEEFIDYFNERFCVEELCTESLENLDDAFNEKMKSLSSNFEA